MKIHTLAFALMLTAGQVPAQSVEERVRDLERQLGNTEPTAEQREQMRKDLEEIKAIGLIDLAVAELKKKNSKAVVTEISAGYFPNRETVPISIIYSDPSAKSAQQELVFHKKEKGWEITTWRKASILDAK